MSLNLRTVAYNQRVRVANFSGLGTASDQWLDFRSQDPEAGAEVRSRLVGRGCRMCPGVDVVA
jgi:hypothetical protein